MPIGVQSGEKMIGEGGGRVMRDLGNKRDLFSPDSAFGLERMDRWRSLALAPFVQTGNGSSYGDDAAMDIFTYAYHGISTFCATMLLTLVVVGGRHIMNVGSATAAEAAIFGAFIAAMAWLVFTRFFTFDRRLSPTHNPAIETAKTFSCDNSGLISWALLSGFQFAGGAAGGAIIKSLGYNTATLIDVVSPDVNWTLSIFAQSFIVGAYLFTKKLTFMGETAGQNWKRVTGATSAMIFVFTLIGTQLGMTFLLTKNILTCGRCVHL